MKIFKKVHQGSSSLAIWFISRKSTSAERLEAVLRCEELIKFLILQNTHRQRKLNEPFHFRTAALGAQKVTSQGNLFGTDRRILLSTASEATLPVLGCIFPVAFSYTSTLLCILYGQRRSVFDKKNKISSPLRQQRMTPG